MSYTIKFYKIVKTTKNENGEARIAAIDKAKDTDISLWMKDSKATYSLVQGKGETVTGGTSENEEKTITYTKEATYLLKDVSYHKEVYQPGYLEFVVQITLTSRAEGEQLTEGTTPKDYKLTDLNVESINDCPLIDLIDENGKTLMSSYWVFNTKFRKDVCRENKNTASKVHFALTFQVVKAKKEIIKAMFMSGSNCQ